MNGNLICCDEYSMHSGVIISLKLLERVLKLVKSFLFLFFCVLLISFLSPDKVSADQPESSVVLIKVTGVIDPAIAIFVGNSIDRAVEISAQAIVVEMDTPGGLDASMRTIVQKFIDAELPVIAYVYPSGARAASAGTFISYASTVSAMAPATSIGAAHPVSFSGEISKEMDQKITNDAVSYLKNLAKIRDRNSDITDDLIRESVSLTSEEALGKGVIDVIADDLNDLLSKLDGREVVQGSNKFVLRTANADVVEFEMPLALRLLHILADPNIAYLLMMFGVYGIIYEFASPGLGFSGIGGAICLILALYSFQVLPVNIAGLALIILALILFIVDIIVPSHGILTAGGVIAMIFGSLILINSPTPYLRVAPALIIGISLATAVFFFFALRAVYKAHKAKPTTGQEGIIGEIGEAREDLNREGLIFVQGELWRATSKEEDIIKGDKVIVKNVDGLKLIVSKLNKKKEV
jgi:membrane-bound serine protease (ClpP class)